MSHLTAESHLVPGLAGRRPLGGLVEMHEPAQASGPLLGRAPHCDLVTLEAFRLCVSKEWVCWPMTERLVFVTTNDFSYRYLISWYCPYFCSTNTDICSHWMNTLWLTCIVIPCWTSHIRSSGPNNIICELPVASKKSWPFGNTRVFWDIHDLQ